MSPRLAAIVCTRHRPGPLEDVLADLRLQLEDDDELLVVDQSDPAPRALGAALAEAHGARFLPVAHEGLPMARNRGVAATTAPVLWFVDDDVRLLPGCVAALRAAFEDPGVGGATGRIEERHVRSNAAPTRCGLDLTGRVRTNLTGGRPTSLQTLKGAHMALRRAAVEAVGPSDRGYGGTAFLEDADWSTRVREAGWRLAYVPAAALVHLSAGEGGVRATRRDAERSRFRNTGRFVYRHRRPSAPLVLATFGAVALRRAWAWRDASAVPELLGELVGGWREAQEGSVGGAFGLSG